MKQHNKPINADSKKIYRNRMQAYESDRGHCGS